MDKPPPFIDMVQSALADPEHGLFLARPWREARKDGHSSVNMRLTLERAKVFTLSDDFTRIACETSMQDPGVMLNALSCARLPYDTVWMEWDEEVRLTALSGIIGEDSAMRIGCLLTRLPGYDDVFKMQTFWLHRDSHKYVKAGMTTSKKVFVSMLNTYWNTSGEVVKINVPLMPNDLKNQDMLLGRFYHKTWAEHEHLADLEERLAVGIGDGFHWNVSQKKMDEEVKKMRAGEDATLAHMLYGALMSVEGDMRHIIAVLSLLQTKWVDKHLTRPSSGVRGMRGVRSKWLDVHTCVITAPKERIVRGYARMVGTGALRRRHDVMGHWCERYGTGLKDCVHEFVENDKHQEVCKHCHLTRWWRKAHARGSSDIGLVKKTYEVRAP